MRAIYAMPPPPLSDEALNRLLISFYHVTDLPNGITTQGGWDLRRNVDAYIGNVDLRGKRVLEIGPASGYLTMEMERRGAEVVALEIPEDRNWDFVPHTDDVMAGVRADRASDLQIIRKTFWHTHRAFNLKAKVVYADVYDIPEELGDFDIALLAAVLLHTSNPQKIIAECAARAREIVITEVSYFDIEEQRKPLLRLHPTRENKDWGTWWHFTSTFFTQYLAVLGFATQAVTYHKQRHARVDRDADFFTVVAARQVAGAG